MTSNASLAGRAFDPRPAAGRCPSVSSTIDYSLSTAERLHIDVRDFSRTNITPHEVRIHDARAVRLAA